MLSMEPFMVPHTIFVKNFVKRTTLKREIGELQSWQIPTNLLKVAKNSALEVLIWDSSQQRVPYFCV